VSRHDDDINSLFVGERNNTATNDFGTQKQQRLALVIVAVVYKPVDSIFLKGGCACIDIQIAVQFFA
jgi:hypothetical protein